MVREPRNRSRPGSTDRIGGQALVEFCLVLPLLLLVLSIAVDVARYLHYQLVLEQVATDAARYATIRDPSTGGFPSPAQVDGRITAALPKSLGPCTILKNLNATVGGDSAVSLRITCQATPFSPALNCVIPTPFAIQAEAWHPKR